MPTCRDWGKRFMRLYPQYTSWENPKDPERPLVIGYVSPDFFTHSVSYFIEAPLAYHDYANFKVVVYSAVVKVFSSDIKTTNISTNCSCCLGSPGVCVICSHMLAIAIFTFVFAIFVCKLISKLPFVSIPVPT
jgi:hypothetical protein